MSGAIKINGTSSGSTTITAPASGGDESIELSTALAAKADVSGETWTGTHDFSGATVTGVGGLAHLHTGSFSGVSSLSVDNVFSSTYDNYMMKLDVATSADGDLYARMRASGTDNTSANYSDQLLSVYGTTINASRNTAQTTGRILRLDSSNHSLLTAEIFAPALADDTAMRCACIDTGDANTLVLKTFNYFHNVASAFDGITIYPSTGTITGSISIYGYAKA